MNHQQFITGVTGDLLKDRIGKNKPPVLNNIYTYRRTVSQIVVELFCLFALADITHKTDNDIFVFLLDRRSVYFHPNTAFIFSNQLKFVRSGVFAGRIRR